MQAIAEERAATKFRNFEVLNSYFVGSAGSRRFFEVILLDRASSSITSDPIYRNVIAQKARAFRGLTYAGRKHRGMAKHSFATGKLGPSKNQSIREH
jgi:large subunit ribosomal protein L15e